MEYEEVISFWFEEIEPKQMWVKDDKFDDLLRDKFLEVHGQIIVGEKFSWRATPVGRLAEIIVIDQFSRNMFRGDPRSFAYDPIGLILAQETVKSGDDQKITKEMRSFLYMPYMHSESLVVHAQGRKLFEALGSSLDYMDKHSAIIEKWGRYPHRNDVVGRESTPEEIEFLKGPGSSF